MCVRVCMCVCVLIYIYAYVCTNMHMYTDTHTHIYTHIHKMTPVLSGWDHAWERETYPLIPYFTDHYRGFVGGFFFFMKHVTGEKKKSANHSGFWRPWLLKRRAAKGLGIL